MYIGIGYTDFRLNELLAKIIRTSVNGSATQPPIVETDRRRKKYEQVPHRQNSNIYCLYFFI